MGSRLRYRLSWATSSPSMTSLTSHQVTLLAGKACGLPVNASKALAGSLQAGIQGGHLDGDRDTICLPPDKLHTPVLCTLALLTKSQWTKQMLRRWVGLSTFIALFRRPVFPHARPK